MKEGQDKIYFLTGESYAQVKNSPHLEVFRKKGIEVLLTDRIDEWLMSYLTEFDGKLYRCRPWRSGLGQTGLRRGQSMGKLVAIPTETVYGLAAKCAEREGRSFHEAKQRPFLI